MGHYTLLFNGLEIKSESKDMYDVPKVFYIK